MAPGDAFPAEMPNHPPGRIEPLDDGTAERLLDGRLDPEDAPPAYAEVARLLRAAAGPARPEELAGEAAAVAAFRRARHRPARVRARLVAVALAGTLLGGGVALAAGGVPVPVERVARAVHRAGGPPATPDPARLRPRQPARATGPAVPGREAGPAAAGRPPTTGGGVARSGRPLHGIHGGKPARPGKPHKPKHGKPKGPKQERPKGPKGPQGGR
jgi:hypothetical protein